MTCVAEEQGAAGAEEDGVRGVGVGWTYLGQR